MNSCFEDVQFLKINSMSHISELMWKAPVILHHSFSKGGICKGLGSVLVVLNFKSLIRGVNEEFCTTGRGLGRIIGGVNVGVRFNRCRFRRDTFGFDFVLEIGSKGGIMISGFKVGKDCLDVSNTFPVISNKILCFGYFAWNSNWHKFKECSSFPSSLVKKNSCIFKLNMCLITAQFRLKTRKCMQDLNWT